MFALAFMSFLAFFFGFSLSFMYLFPKKEKTQKLIKRCFPYRAKSDLKDTFPQFALAKNLRLLDFLTLKLLKSDDDQRYWKHMC